jgi:predicted phosphodiesterase
MILQITSDLHLEYQSKPLEFMESQVHHTDDNSNTVLIAAGDIGKISWSLDIVEEFCEKHKYKDFVWVAGNHEFYYSNITKFVDDKDMLLTSKVIDGVRFLATPLYSNFNPPSDRCGINDFNVTDYGNGKWTPKLHREAHKTCVELLDNALNSPFEGKTVVVTHFLPSHKSVDPQYFGDPLNEYFANNLDYLIEKYKPSMWIHGHTHTNCDYVLDNTRVLCNPAGYWNKYSSQLENLNYNKNKILEV